MTPLLEIIIFGLVGLILFAGFVLLCKSFRREPETKGTQIAAAARKRVSGYSAEQRSALLKRAKEIIAKGKDQPEGQDKKD